ncbi:MAG TPA: hypothetical protein VNO30_38445 [Kofleriaceae bacterium]|nr:hypothetical protein [Kofleriaceae bacterium]
MTKDDVERHIDLAFAGEAMPRTERELCEPGIEAPYVIEHFLGRARDDVHAASFRPSLHMEDFTYMTRAAVAYYLPPVLKLVLREPLGFELWTHLSGFLRSARHASADNLRDLTSSQLAAIADCLAFLADERDGSFGFKAKDARKLATLYRELAATR